ncbi:uncharacterized protein LOC116245637 [Nymphaea colorata]|nr:uncharacterized protein LOC116245637 [Nymphaea colorata]
MMNLCRSFWRFSEGNDDGGDDGGGRRRKSFSFHKEDEGGNGVVDAKKPPSGLHRSRSLPCQGSSSAGLSLIAAAAEVQKPRNVLESSAVRRPVGAGPALVPAFRQNDDSGLEQHPCTEGLGSESSDETGPSSSGESRDGEVDSGVAWRERVYLEKWARRKMIARQRVRSELPPPLPWLSTKGRPSFVLHPERRDGRILMTAVRLDQHDVFLATRHSGRLTLQLVGRPPRPSSTTTNNNHDGADDLKEESEELDEQEQEDEDHGSPERPVHVAALDGPTEENDANCEAAQEKQEVQAERIQSLAKCLNAAITIASKIEVQEYEKHDGGGLINEYYTKESEKEDKSDSGVAHLLPAMTAGSSQGSCRCCDCGELGDFWNHRYVAAT